MDGIAHTLWTAAVADSTRRIVKKPIHVGWTTFFGIAPDLFAFTPLVLWFAFKFFTGDLGLADIPKPSEFEPFSPDTFSIYALTIFLYNASHSAILWGLVFFVAMLVMRRIPWEFLGWLFHIALDLFSHSYAVSPTPALWPFSSWHFDGIPWYTPWFAALNYTALFLVYASMYQKKLVAMLSKFLRKNRMRFAKIGIPKQ